VVALTASGEIFSLRAEGGLAADEWARAAGGARLRGDVMAELALCHGISAALGAQVAAEAQARLGALWILAASGDADASAQARAFARGLFSGNVFDDFGVALQAGAEASASASAQAAAGLDAAGVAALAGEALDGLALDLFLAFLNEVRIEGGAKAVAYAGASALAEVAVAGNLLAEPSRFEIAAGASAALATGAGARAFFRCELDDPKRLAANSAELIAAEVASAARAHLPASAHGLVEFLELLVPVAFGCAWEVGEVSALDSLASPDAFAERLIRVVSGQVQRWVLDRGVELGLERAAAALAELPVLAGLDDLDPLDREALADRLDAIADALSGRPVAIAELADTAGAIVAAVAEVLGDGVARSLRRPLALAWTAAAAVIALRDPVATGSAGASVAGLGAVEATSAAGQGLAVPDLPAFVRAEWSVLLGGRVGRRATFGDCIDVLVAAGLGRDLERVPRLGPLLRELAGRLDLTVGDLVEAALAAGLGRGLTRTDLYQRLRDLVAEGIDGAIATELLPRLRAALPADDGARRWVDEAAAPSLLALRSFGLERLDALVTGAVSGDLGPFLTRLRTLLGVLAGKLVLRNVEVLAEVLTDHVLDGLPAELRRLAGEVERGAGGPVVGDWARVVPALLPPVVLAEPDDVARASRTLLAGLLEAAAEGLEVYTPARRRALAALQRRAWRVDDLAVDYADPAGVGGFVDDVLDCSFIPDPEAVVELATLSLTLLAEQLARTVPRAATLLVEFFATVTAPAVAELQRGLRGALGVLDRGLERVRELIDELDGALREALEDLEDALRDLDAALDAAQRALGSQDTRDRVREEIRKAGRATAIDTLGDGGGVVFDVAWAAFGWVVDPALAVLGATAGWLDDAVEGAADVVQAAGEVEAELARRARAAMFGVDLGDLADFLGLGDIVDAVGSAARQPGVQSALDSATGAGRRRDRARERRDRTQEELGEARAQRRALVVRRAGMNTRAVTLRILDPAPLRGDPRRAIAHAGLVELRVALGGGDARLLAPRAPRRLEVSLNGAPVRLAPSHLVAAPNGAQLRRPLTAADGLRPGLNVVECAVAQPRGDAARQAVAFAVHPRTPVGPGVRIEGPGDGRVAVVNAGREAARLEGWRIADRAGRGRRLEGVVLEPGRRVEVETARARPGEGVYLVGPDGLVRDEAVAGAGEDSRG